jgi:hypothetical protein
MKFYKHKHAENILLKSDGLLWWFIGSYSVNNFIEDTHGLWQKAIPPREDEIIEISEEDAVLEMI